MNKTLVFHSILFLFFISTSFLSAQVETDSVEKEKAVEMPKSFPKIKGNDFKKYDQEKKEWVEKHPEEYRRMGGNPDFAKDQPIIPELSENKPVTIDKSTPNNGVYWKMIAADVKANNSSVSNTDLVVVKKELEQDISDRNWTWIIGDNRVLMVANDNSFAVHHELTETQLILKVNKECNQCRSRIYTVKEKTESKLIISIPLDDNPAITSIFSFEKIVRP